MMDLTNPREGGPLEPGSTVNTTGTIPAPGMVNNSYDPASQNTTSLFGWPRMNTATSGSSGYLTQPNNGGIREGSI